MQNGPIHLSAKLICRSFIRIGRIILMSGCITTEPTLGLLRPIGQLPIFIFPRRLEIYHLSEGRGGLVAKCQAAVSLMAAKHCANSGQVIYNSPENADLCKPSCCHYLGVYAGTPEIALLSS